MQEIDINRPINEILVEFLNIVKAYYLGLNFCVEFWIQLILLPIKLNDSEWFAFQVIRRLINL